MAGRFVVLEGPEGAGKSTLARALEARARAAGLAPLLVREPGGTPAAERARAILLDPGHHVGEAAELFLVLAARAEVVREVIRPALAAGRFVLADRYELSTFAYQVAGRGLPAELVRAANRLATGGLTPDLTLVLDLPHAEGRRRQVVAGKSLDRLDAETPAFHQRVEAAYLAARGPGVRHLDGTLAPAELEGAAWDVLLRECAPLVAGPGA